MKRALSLFATVVLLAQALVACAPGPSGTAPAAPAAKPARAAPPAAGQPAAQSAPPALPADYFAGKTVTMVVNFSAGGPTDVFARMVAQHLEKHIPGRPKIIVENKPGAGGVIGANHVYNVAKKDGLTLGVFSSPFAHQVFEDPGAQYDAAQFLWLAGVAETSLVFVSPSLGVSRAQDLPQARGEIVVGGLSPDGTKDKEMRTFLNLLGMNYKYVTGYPGQAEINLAFRRGEITFAHDSLTTWTTGIVPMMKEGSAVTIVQRGIVKNGQIVRDPRANEYPTYLEVAVDLKGEAVKRTVEYRALTMLAQLTSILRTIIYPPGTDPAAAEVMRKALADTFADPEFQATIDRQLGFQFEFVPGAEAQELARLTISGGSEDAEALDYLKRVVN